MIMKDKIQQTIKEYDAKNIYIGVLGSHSALEIRTRKNLRPLLQKHI